MSEKQKPTPIEVETIGAIPFGVMWQGEYYPVTVENERWTKDCSAKIYTVKSEQQLVRIRHDVRSGVWMLEPTA